MAEPLKNHFGPDVAVRIADAMRAVEPGFDHAGFVARCVEGFEDLELTQRARQIADALAEFLPADRARALEIVIASLGPELENCDPQDAAPTDDGPEQLLSGFLYMPHGYFIAEHGPDHFELGMRANYELTKRFTAEFAIRPYLEARPDEALQRLSEWADDENVHVRRLVSEGTRPRLPWAPRLDVFRADPTPVIELLDKLKDDPAAYVRRSVANNLNDIAKEHPHLVVDLCERWWADGDAHRRKLVRHALRTLIKNGDPAALAVLGFRVDSPVDVEAVTIDPTDPAIGGRVRIEVVLINPGEAPAAALVDLRVGFVKANGTVSPKVFKGGEFDLEPGATARLRKTISLSQHSTRTHHPGIHHVDVLVNGVAHPAGSFELRGPPQTGRTRRTRR